MSQVKLKFVRYEKRGRYYVAMMQSETTREVSGWNRASLQARLDNLKEQGETCSETQKALDGLPHNERRL